MSEPIEHRDDGVVVLSPSGRLDLQRAPVVRQHFAALVEDGARLIVVDLSDVTFVDSSGLGSLISGLKTARQASGDLRIAGAGPQVISVLELTQLHRVLKPYADVEAALSAG